MPIDYKVDTEPHYYRGKIHKYSAKNIVDDFDLTPWTAQAVQYILRAGKKEGNSTAQDIRKAINVLHFELDKLHEEDKTKTGGLAK
jgi:hypothetical protein